MDFQSEFDRIMDEVTVRNGTFPDMAEEAFDLIKSKNQVAEFFAEFGRESLIALFRQRAHVRREAPLAGPRLPGRPKFTAAALNHPDAIAEIFAIPFTVDGKQKRLGELTQADCVWLENDYAKRANTLASRAEFFGSLSMQLDGAVTVRQAFEGKANQLLAAYKKGFGDQ